MRVSIFLICLALALPISASAAISSESAPDWPMLQNSLDEIEQGLLMTDAPLNSIESGFAERELRLQLKEQELNATEIRSQQREQELNERAQGLDQRELLYSGMEASVAKANKRLKRGLLWLGLAFAGGLALGLVVK